MARLRSFAQWLARNAGLVNSLSMKPVSSGSYDAAVDGLPVKAHVAAAQELLHRSIQAAGATQAAEDTTQLSAPLPAAAAAAAAAAAVTLETAVGRSQQQQQQQQQQQGLRLRSFSCSLPRAVDMLAALQVQHLTRVDLGFEGAATDSCAPSLALARLSNLQQLRLGNLHDGLATSLSTLVQLPQLTSLEFYDSWSGVLKSPLSVALQQLLAQPLPLKRLQLLPRGSCRLPVLNMALLTKLTELNTSHCELTEACVLPAQLQALCFRSWAGARSMATFTLLELKQLQHLSLRVDFEQPQLLLQLAQLPALTHLELQYVGEGHPAAATASAWPLLPQLRSLEIAHDMPPNQPQWEAILAGAAAATSLTKLKLDARMMSDAVAERYNRELEDVWAEEVAACARLAKLTCLQDLTVGGFDDIFKVNFECDDALALTALTGLTRLDLWGAQHGVGTEVATALALNLKQLQSLDLGYCDLQLDSAEGSACLEAIGGLTQLTQLGLADCEGLTQHGLMQLTGLSRLQKDACLALGHWDDEHWDDEQCEALTAFWAAVHAQRL
jgi:hypothetical protein